MSTAAFIIALVAINILLPLLWKILLIVSIMNTFLYHDT